MESFNIMSDADDKAIGESVASQLPGREMGPADAYRHVLLAAELTRELGPGWATAGLLDHELDPESGADNGLDFWNNAIGMAIGMHVKNRGGDWTDVVRLTREVVSRSLSGDGPNTLEQRWISKPAIEGLSKFYQESPLSNRSPLTPPFDIWRQRFNQSGSFYVSGVGEVDVDGGMLRVSPVAVETPRAWRKNPALLDSQGNVLLDEAGKELRMTNSQANWPRDDGLWARGHGFLYEPGNAAPPLIGSFAQPSPNRAAQFESGRGVPLGDSHDGLSDSERRARRFYDRTYRR